MAETTTIAPVCEQREEARDRRLAALIDGSAAGGRIGPLRRPS